jgi:hypothetical protein
MAEGSPVLTEASTSSRDRWSWTLLGLVALVGGFIVVRDRHDLVSAFGEIGWAAMTGSLVLAMVGTWVLLGLWLSVLRALGAEVPFHLAWRIFFVSQLGKYLPGSVWPALAQMEAGRRWGVRRSVMLAGNLLTIAVLAGSGVVVGLVLLPGSVGLAGVPGPVAWLLAAALLAVCLRPTLLTRLVDAAFRIARREPPTLQVSTRAMAVSFAWALATWVLYGVHVWLLARAVGGSGVDLWVAATGGIALGWALGLLAVLAPAGLGVRDAVVLAALAPLVGRSPALAVTLASRGLLSLADVLLAAAAALLPRRRALARDSGESEE